MRNLKRALSLAMATVMLMSMTVISAGALSFNDADDISDVTAATVLEALEVMVGDDAGNFNPDEVVTRAEMATILCRVVYGTDYEADGYIGLTTFTDISGHWGEAAISMAYANGWINGKDAETFDPNATVLAYEAYVMIQRALGYYDDADTTAYALGTYAMTLASKTGINDGITTGAYVGLTRDSVATAVYNAMFDTPKVAYSTWTGIYYACDVVDQEDNGSYENWTPDITSPSINISFGTEGTFAYDVHDVEIVDTFDMMGRAVNSIEVDGDEVATAPVEADAIFYAGTQIETIEAAGVEMDTAYAEFFAYGNRSDIGEGTFANTYFSDSPADFATACTDNETLQNGYVVEVYNYGSGATKSTDYIVYSYAIGEILDIDYDEDDDETIIRIDSNGKDYYYYSGDASDLFEEGDIVMFTAGDNNEGSSTDDYIDTMVIATTIEGEATGVSTGSYWYIDGTKYSAIADSMYWDINGDTVVVSDEVALYLDPQGYVIASEVIEGVATAYDYLYVMDTTSSLSTVTAKVLFADGSEAIITIDEIDEESAKYEKAATDYTEPSKTTYTVYTGAVYEFDENSDGTYDLWSISTSYADSDTVYYANPDDNIIIENGYTRPLSSASATYATYIGIDSTDTAEKTAYFTDETVFVDAEENESFVGYENVVDFDGTVSGYIAKTDVVAVIDDGDVLVLFIMNGDQSGSGSAGTYVYVDDDGYYKILIDDDSYFVYEDIYLDGEQVTLTVETTSNVFADDTAYEITVDDDGYVTAVAELYDNDYTEGSGWTSTTSSDEEYYNGGDDFFMSDLYVKTVGSSYIATNDAAAGDGEDIRYSYDSDTIFVYIDEDGNVSEGSKSDIETNSYLRTGTSGDHYYTDDFTLIHVVCDEDNYAIVVFIEAVELTGSWYEFTNGDYACKNTSNPYFENTAYSAS